MAFPFRLSRRGVWLLTGALAAGALLLIVGTGLFRTPGLLPEWTPEWLRFTVGQMDLVEENVAAVWYSSLLFLLLTPAAAACFWIDRLRAGGARARFGSLGWWVIAAVGLLLSLSEMGSLHETTHRVAEGPFADALAWWLAPLAIPIAIVLALLLWFLWTRLRRHRRTFWLVSSGLLLYVNVLVQEQIEGMMRDRASEPAALFERPLLHIWLEEGSELFGSILLLAGMAFYLLFALGRKSGSGMPLLRSGEGRRPRVEIALEGRSEWREGGVMTGSIRVSGRRFLWSVVFLLSLLGLGMGVIAALLELFSEARARGPEGDAMNWFPSMLASLLGLASIYASRMGPRVSVRLASLRVPLLLAGMYALLVAVDLGADRALSGDLWEGNPRWQAAVDVGFATGAALCAGMLWRAGGTARIPLAVWALLLAALFLLQPPSGAAALAYVAFCAFGLGVSLLWAEAETVAPAHGPLDGAWDEARHGGPPMHARLDGP